MERPAVDAGDEDTGGVGDESRHGGRSSLDRLGLWREGRDVNEIVVASAHADASSVSLPRRRKPMRLHLENDLGRSPDRLSEDEGVFVSSSLTSVDIQWTRFDTCLRKNDYDNKFSEGEKLWRTTH